MSVDSNPQEAGQVLDKLSHPITGQRRNKMEGKSANFKNERKWQEKNSGILKSQKETTYNKGKNVPTENRFNLLAISENVADVASSSKQLIETSQQSAADLATERIRLVKDHELTNLRSKDEGKLEVEAGITKAEALAEKERTGGNVTVVHESS
ncbi:hypothetical protein LIER_36217 [Lithospermum erythrorhizon]|uniref:Uncharacterized protein n=1 Tax=Lithospermum erythrorhizon TaxID=34254 RepID=A0AAV3P4B7_LITER